VKGFNEPQQHHLFAVCRVLTTLDGKQSTPYNDKDHHGQEFHAQYTAQQRVQFGVFGVVALKGRVAMRTMDDESTKQRGAAKQTDQKQRNQERF
tara:strand:- start:7 stop:288 length:282 start_codon:yes stop_codon:yes gene_type:complete